MNRITTAFRYLLLGLPLFLTAGCYELGQMGDVFGDLYGQKSEIVGEIRSVDSRSREIEVRADDRRTRSIKYNGQTRVIYQDREYSVSNLERGDYVAMRIQTDGSGDSYTDLIRVRESAQQRSGDVRGSRTDRLEGTVDHVDARRGQFELTDDSGRRVTVTLPYNPRRNDAERLQDLRRGDHVRIEGRFLNSDRFELESFV